MIRALKALLKELSTAPKGYILMDIDCENHYKLVKNGEKTYLLDLSNNNLQNNISIGYFIEKKDLPNYKNKDLYPELIIFDEGSGFIPHNVEGPAYYMTHESSISYSYIIHGLSLDNKKQFNLNPEVIAHKNKVNLKKKLKSL